MDAVAVFPVPPFVAATLPVVFTWFPVATAVTFTANVHPPLAAIVPPVRETLCEPATAVTVPLPHEPVSPFGVATVNPAGNGSLNATPSSASDALELRMVKLSVVVPARPMVAAPNDLEILGGAPTVRFAVAVLPVPPLVEVTAPVVFV